MIRTIKIWWFTRRLRSSYLYLRRLEASYSCGLMLLGSVSPTVVRARDQVNHYIDVLNKLDPDANLTMIH